MFTYKGYNPESRKKIEKEFEDEYEAVDYARENYSDYPVYKVVDLSTDIVIDSNKIAAEDETQF